MERDGNLSRALRNNGKAALNGFENVCQGGNWEQREQRMQRQVKIDKNMRIKLDSGQDCDTNV